MRQMTKFAADASIVVIVDVQNDFCHPDGKLARSGTDVSAYEELVPRLNSFLTAARERSVPLVWIQTWRDDSTNSGVWLARNSLYLDPPAADIPQPLCLKNSWGADFFGVAPEPGEPIVAKIRYSAFTGTDLETVLRTLGRTSLLFTGVETNVCVESTMREALFREFHVSIIEDCCYSTIPGAHAATIETIRRYFGLALHSTDVIRAWEDEKAQAKAVGAVG